MFKLCYMSSRWLAVQVPMDHFDDPEDREGIVNMIEEGYPTLFCDDLETAADALGIDVSEIEVAD